MLNRGGNMTARMGKENYSYGSSERGITHGFLR